MTVLNPTLRQLTTQAETTETPTRWQTLLARQVPKPNLLALVPDQLQLLHCRCLRLR
jgi:hypothetical protein